MGPDAPSLTGAGTFARIELCRLELDRLQEVLSEFKSGNRTFLNAAQELQTKLTPRHFKRRQTWEELAEQTRTLAETAYDPLVRYLLLELAIYYDKLTKWAEPGKLSIS